MKPETASLQDSISQWQQKIYSQDAIPDLGPISQLYTGTRDVFSSVLKLILQAEAPTISTHYTDLRTQFHRYFLWYEGWTQLPGGLDQLLFDSQALRATVLRLMVLWAQCVRRIPETRPDYHWPSLKDQLLDFVNLIDQMKEIAEATMPSPSENRPFPIDLGIPQFSDDGSDSASDSSSDCSDDCHDKVVGDFATWMDALIDLSPTLAYPAPDRFLGTEVDAKLSEDFDAIPLSYRSFVIAIKDAFPLVPVVLARRLGEGNLRRIERLRNIRDGKEMSISNIPVTEIPKPQNRGIGRGAARSSSDAFSISDPSIFTRTTITGTSGSAPSIFDQIRAQRLTISPTNSIVSLTPSTRDGDSSRRRQLPPIPTDYEFGELLHCPTCKRVLLNIRSLNDWHKHVKHDLQPYMCLALDCFRGSPTFRSSKEWMDHEFLEHGRTMQWACNLCPGTISLESAKSLESHLEEKHYGDISIQKINELVWASRYTIPRDFENEVCPFCKQMPGRTRNQFRSHVGKHLLQISLVCIAGTEHSTENTSDDTDGDETGSDETDKTKNALVSLLKEARIAAGIGTAVISAHLNTYPTWFIPNEALNRIVTEDRVKQLLESRLILSPEKRVDYASVICSGYIKMTAILTLIFSLSRAVSTLLRFVDANITDIMLPFEFSLDSTGNYLLGKMQTTSPHFHQHALEILKDWNKESTLAFEQFQWEVLAPIFRKGDGDAGIPHYELDDKIVLPFAQNFYGYHQYSRSDPYEEVLWPVRFASGHQDLYHPAENLTQEPLLAIKEAFNYGGGYELFETEKTVLGRPSSKSHTHILQLLATYTWKNHPYSIYPYAKGTLAKMWDLIRTPNHNQITYLWAIEQMVGITSALNTLHCYGFDSSKVGILDVLSELRESAAGKLAQVQLVVHRNITCEVILWQDKDESDPGAGYLLLSGFSFSRGGKSDSEINAAGKTSIAASDTYNAPEFFLGKDQSRKCDIWSLGCVFTKLINWLLEGHAGIARFDDAREGEEDEYGVNTRAFYASTWLIGPSKAWVHPEVTDQFRKLRQNKRCSPSMNDILTILENRTILIDAEDRINTYDLQMALEAILQKCKVDPEYLVGPNPMDEGKGFKMPDPGISLYPQ